MPVHTYPKNFLSDVIFRIDYPTILDLVSDVPKDFQNKIYAKFPSLEPIKQAGIRFENKGPELETFQETKTLWKFTNSDGKRTVELDREYLAIVIKDYKNFQEFLELIGEITTYLFELYPSITISRLGLRYVNIINLPGGNIFDWTRYINQNLISSLSFIEDKSKLKRHLGAFVFDIDNDSILDFKYGMINNKFPNKIIDKEFYLDFDCHTRVNIDKDNLSEKLKNYNSLLTAYFEKSIKPGLRRVMNSE